MKMNLNEWSLSTCMISCWSFWTSTSELTRLKVRLKARIFKFWILFSRNRTTFTRRNAGIFEKRMKYVHTAYETAPFETEFLKRLFQTLLIFGKKEKTWEIFWNLAIHSLKNGEIQEAEKLMKSVEPSQPAEYILKAIIHLQLGNMEQSKEHLKTAQQYFQVVGQSATECDTIPGRQCKFWNCCLDLIFEILRLVIATIWFLC